MFSFRVRLCGGLLPSYAFSFSHIPVHFFKYCLQAPNGLSVRGLLPSQRLLSQFNFLYSIELGIIAHW